MRASLLFSLALLFPASLLAQDVDYLRDIKPILKERCWACHGALKQQAKLRLDTGQSILRGGRGGPAVQPHDLGSLLLQRVSEKDADARMPPEGKPLSEKEIGLLRAWIVQGAKVPSDEQPEPDPRDHWAFRKPIRPMPPKSADPRWSRHPIDAFLAAEWAKRGLTPNPPAEKTVLLRRVFLDLIGLPPTREELHAFLNDTSPDAYEKVVDRLLADPRHGERWGRHWMDVWRYSDWYGRRTVPDVLNSYGMIWRWRDWIVRSLNEDRGYDQMILEMLAADEIAATEDDKLVATGFIVRNFFRWNYHQWKKDLVEHTGKAFLGLTLNCCHCHDHKYDPISHEEYFRFRAFFEPIEIRHDRVPGEPDPGMYPKYNYGSAYGPIKSGMVRIFDDKLDAITYMYTGGDHRNRIEGKPPVQPGTPAILGGTLAIEKVTLPVTAYYPALKESIVREEEARRLEALSRAKAELARNPGKLAEMQVKAAEADLTSYRARLAADRARYVERKGSAASDLFLAASKAEREHALAAAELNRLQLQQMLEQAKGRPAAEVQKLQKALAAAEVDVTQKQKELAAPPTEKYTPLGPLFPRHSTGRRTALAKWIASKDNPLTARVAVNHIWAWHFGRPLVETTWDLGRNGKRPSHPELLDWLAVELMEPQTEVVTGKETRRQGDKETGKKSTPQGKPPGTGRDPTPPGSWTMKRLHRLIVTSQAYRMGSGLTGPDHPHQKIDPDNRFFWRFPISRMEAEMVRDSVLYLAGELDCTLGGADIPHEQGLTSKRRSLYFTHHGESRMQFLELFDAANPCDCYRRTTSILPQQALALSNSELVLRQSRILAHRLWQKTGKEEVFLQGAFEQVLGRPPTAAEAKATLAFLARQVKLFQDSGLRGPASPPTTGENPSTDPAMRARENLIQALFNHNDFVTIR